MLIPQCNKSLSDDFSSLTYYSPAYAYFSVMQDGSLISAIDGVNNCDALYLITKNQFNLKVFLSVQSLSGCVMHMLDKSFNGSLIDAWRIKFTGEVFARYVSGELARSSSRTHEAIVSRIDSTRRTLELKELPEAAQLTKDGVADCVAFCNQTFDVLSERAGWKKEVSRVLDASPCVKGNIDIRAI